MAMEYRDELKLRLIQYDIEPTENIVRFIDLETIPLKSYIMELRENIEDLIMTSDRSYEDTRKQSVELLNKKV